MIKKRMLNLSKRIYTAPCNSYDYQKVKTNIFELLDKMSAELKIESFEGKKVALKPNLLAMRSPEGCVTTNPEIVRSAAEYFVQKGAQCVICDSSGGLYNASVMARMYKVTGMQYAAQQSGASLNEDFGFKTVKFAGKASSSFNIINPLAQADLIVNLCRLKTHSLTLMSNAVKNMYGSIPGLQKAEMHARFPGKEDFASYVVDLCTLNAPQMNISDAICAMEGNGPSAGQIKKVGLLLASVNPFALDLAASKVMGFETQEISTLKESIKRQLCPQSADELEIEGVELEKFATKFVRPDAAAKSLISQLPFLFDGKLQKFLEPRPYVNKSKCVGCGECAKCCPQSTIVIKDKKAVIYYDKCIKCYCCQELCPKKAIDIKRRIFFNL